MTTENQSNVELLKEDGNVAIAEALDRYEAAHPIVNGFVLHLPVSEADIAAAHIAEWTEATEGETAFTVDELVGFIRENNQVKDELSFADLYT